MSVIKVSERSREPDGSFGVQVVFGDEAEYAVRVSDPAGPGTEELLAWYFEKHLRFPFLDLDLEHKAVAQLADYGRDLFGQVLGGEANHDYRTLRERAFDGCRLEVTGSAAFHLLHWEALRDPKMDVPLAVRLPVTRRVGQLESKFKLPPERATLNILVVTARPFGPGDVGYRTISRPLLDAVRQSELPVTIDLVRPGTWEALREHLQSATEQHQSGWYQVIHFDLHGGFSDFTDLDQMRQQGNLLFQAVKVEPFEGKRPFLFFETAHDGKAGPVPAATVASLLGEHRIPVAVLNACQSAMQADSEASLALQLVQAGIPAAVGMAYSVTVSAAVQAMPVLYRRLTQGADPLAALHAARRSLYDRRGRHAYFDQQLDLEDWVLPVAFRQQPLRLQLRPMDDAEQTRFLLRQADVGEEPSTEYGFVGRDLDIQAIERRLLTSPDGNEILVHGMAGAGKSTLLRHLAWWWQRTSLVDEVFAFSYEDRAWTCNQIIREIRTRLLTKVDQARADNMPDSAQLQQVANLLRANRHLLILDNVESITAAPAAIPHALSPSEQAQIKTMLSRLGGGKTLVLIGSREREEWLAASSFRGNTYPLPGLDPQAASTLVERILHASGARGWLQDTAERAALQDLVDVLGGYPLPMTVVLPILADSAPSVVLADLKTGGISPDPAGQITRAIEYSHGKLDPALQTSLLLLAPFTAVIPTGSALGYYRDLLRQDEAVQSLGPIDLDDAVAETVRVGLATPHPQMSNMVQVQPVLPYFLRSRLRQHNRLQAATSQAHYELCAAIGSDLLRLLTSLANPEEREIGQTATRSEYANLTAALAHGLATAQSIMSVIGPLYEYLDQTKQQTALRSLLDQAIARYPQADSESQKGELASLHNLAGNAALAQHRPADAQTHVKTQLKLFEAIGDRSGQGGSYFLLGNIAYQQRRLEEAGASYQKALDIYLNIGPGHEHYAAGIYHQLGLVAQRQLRFVEAEVSYQKAIDIYLDLGERYELADVYHQLGRVAQGQLRFEDAAASYRQALDIFLEFDDRHSAATSLYQLGRVAQEQKRFAEADTAFRQALDIYLDLADKYETADIYQALAGLAVAQERFDEADTAYHQALSIYLEFDNRHSAADTYRNLGGLAVRQERFEEADNAYHQALDIYLDLGDKSETAGIYAALGSLATIQERFEEADNAYHQALDIYLDLGDKSETAGIYAALGSLATIQERFEEADNAYHQALDIYLDLGDKSETAGIYAALGSLAARQERFEEADNAYHQALDIYLDLGDKSETAGIYAALGSLAATQERFEEAETCYRDSLSFYLESDKRRASMAATTLGTFLAKLGKHAEATDVLLDAAVSWYQLTGNWDPADMQSLKRECQHVGSAEFVRLLAANVPQDFQKALMIAIGIPGES